MIREVWEVVDKTPGIAWALARLDGSFFFVTHSESAKARLVAALPPGDHTIDFNYTDAEIERLKKNKI